MTHAPQNKMDERRRHLLKGALGASTVVTLGYGAPVAAASLSCVAKVPDSEIPLTQFTTTEPVQSSTGSDWVWVKVEIWCYKANGNGKFDGFAVGGNVYNTAAPATPVLGAELHSNQAGYPKDGWLLAYFSDSGEFVGTYPTYQLAEDGATPALASCFTSLNPGFVSSDGSFTFGG